MNKLEYVDKNKFKFDDIEITTTSDLTKHDLLELFQNSYVIIAESNNVWNLF